MKRSVPYLQHDTTSKWDMLTFSRRRSQFIGRRILTTEDKTGALHWIVGGVSVLIPVPGDVYN